MAEKTKYCSNCKRDIAEVNFLMHEVHCRKNIILCDQCKEPVARTELDNHNEEEHALVPCDLCNQDFERRFIDDHKDDCPKRPSQCSYCEIECPRDDLDKHLEYCGTRTEQCEKCGQYIMVKDLNRHEDSNCSYPEPKPNTDSSENPRDDVRFRGGMGIGDFSSSFVRGEMERIMHPPGANPRKGPTSTGTRAHASFLPERFKAKVDNYKRVPNNRIPSEAEVNSHINLERARNMKSLSTAQRKERENIDGKLAAQLANDLALETGAVDDRMVAARESVGRRHEERRDHSSEDEVLIPCEYCGEQFPLLLLLQHQDNCNTVHAANSTSADRSSHTDPVYSSGSLLNNSGAAASTPNGFGSSGSGNSHLSVVNNLSFPVDNGAWNPANFVDDELAVLFPCEFCNDTFPEDILIQHQSVCDRNPYKTPRVMTPKVTNSQRALLNKQNSNSTGPSAASSYSRQRGLPRSNAPTSTYSKYGSNRPSRNVTRTPEVRKQEATARTNHVLDEFIRNPSYTTVNVGQNHGSRAMPGEDRNNYGIHGTSRHSRQSNRSRPVQRSTFDTSGLNAAGSSLRTNSTTQPAVNGSNRTYNTRSKRI